MSSNENPQIVEKLDLLIARKLKVMGQDREAAVVPNPLLRILSRMGCVIIVIGLAAPFIPNSAAIKQITEPLGITPVVAAILLVFGGAFLLAIPSLLGIRASRARMGMQKYELKELDPLAWKVIDEVYDGEDYNQVLADVSEKGEVSADKLELMILALARQTALIKQGEWRFKPLLEQIMSDDS